MADTSGSMTVDDCIPLYNSIGLSIRVSEKCHEAFRDRIMIFDFHLFYQAVWGSLGTHRVIACKGLRGKQPHRGNRSRRGHRTLVLAMAHKCAQIIYAQRQMRM